MNKFILFLGIVFLSVASLVALNVYFKPIQQYKDITTKVVVYQRDYAVSGSNTPVIGSQVDSQKLCEEIPECVGYIYSHSPYLHYPIMQSTTPDKYLRKDPYGKDSYSGSIFMDSRCTWDSDMIIIYGHNMKNNTMFGDLTELQTGNYITLSKGVNSDMYIVEDAYVVKEDDPIYSMTNPIEEPCVVLSTCHGKEDRFVVILTKEF